MCQSNVRAGLCGLCRAESSAYSCAQQLGGIVFSNCVQPKVKSWFLPFQFHHKFPMKSRCWMPDPACWSHWQDPLTTTKGLEIRTESEILLGSKYSAAFHSCICMNSNLMGLLVELETSLSCVWKVSFHGLWSWHGASGSCAVKHGHIMMSTAWSTYLAAFFFYCSMSVLLKVAIAPG